MGFLVSFVDLLSKIESAKGKAVENMHALRKKFSDIKATIVSDKHFLIAGDSVAFSLIQIIKANGNKIDIRNFNLKYYYKFIFSIESIPMTAFVIFFGQEFEKDLTVREWNACCQFVENAIAERERWLVKYPPKEGIVI